MNKKVRKFILKILPGLKPEKTFSPAIAFPLKGIDDDRPFDLHDTFDDIDPMVIETHIPIQKLTPIDPITLTTLSAAGLKSMRKKRLLPTTYGNPLQYLDYRLYETLTKHTFIGALIDSYVKFLMGTGFKPELELINPDEDAEKNQREIQSAQFIIDDLLEIDRQIDHTNHDRIDMSLQDKFASMMTSMIVYNRGALMFVHNKPIIIRGKEYNEIPNHMIFASAPELGLNVMDDQENTLKQIQWTKSIDSLVDVKDMILLWNPLTSAKIQNSQFYGGSMITPMIASSKIIRQLLSNVFPAMAKNAAMGLYLLAINPDGTTSEDKINEYRNIDKGLKSAATSVLLKDPVDVELHNIDYDPKVADFLSVVESQVKMCISTMGLPQVGFYDESAANRATMVGKIQLTMKTTIEPMRQMIGKSICDQHYQRWYELLYKGDKVLDKFKIKIGWSDLRILEYTDQIEAALLADSRFQFKNSAFGKIAGLENYENMLDPKGTLVPGGSGGNKVSLTDDKTGDKVEMKTTKGKGAV